MKSFKIKTFVIEKLHTFFNGHPIKGGCKELGSSGKPQNDSLVYVTTGCHDSRVSQTLGSYDAPSVCVTGSTQRSKKVKMVRGFLKFDEKT